MSSLSFLRPEVAALKLKLDAFVQNECIPCEAQFDAHLKARHGADRWTRDAIPPCVEKLKGRAQELGLWNLFIPPHLIHKVPDASLRPALALTYREYGILCESMGRCALASEACNCSAPDTGNMEVLLEFGTLQQQQQYLLPLLRGEIRSTFLMTEPDVASSDPTNLCTSLHKLQGKDGSVYYELNGRKWWSTGAMDPRTKLALVVAKLVDSSTSTMDKHKAHTIVAADMTGLGVACERSLTCFGYDDAPYGHAEVSLNRVVVTEADLIHGEGSGFQISQARLGPGRIHHCMRAIGMGKCGGRKSLIYFLLLLTISCFSRSLL
jgi:acyl-CoA dehydrogenase